MTGSGFTDWQDVGIFPLQDHDDGVPLHTRQTLAGGRIHRLNDPEKVDDPADSMLVYAQEGGLGTIGDVHPWLFWQTAGRDQRGMGSWSQAWSGLTVEPGGKQTSAAVLPFHFDDLSTDDRYRNKKPGWPGCFPTMPRGVS